MSTPKLKAQERIEDIENMLVKIYSNVISRKAIETSHVESMVESSRKKKEDGFYIFTIRKSNDSHGILAYKETQPDGTVKFYLYEPNGRNHINEGYRFDIRVSSDSSVVELDTRMVPIRSINDYVGHCALWCIIVIILWNSFEGDDRWIALDIFHNEMMSDFKKRKAFIVGVYNLVLTARANFTREDHTMVFIEKVRAMLLNIPIILP